MQEININSFQRGNIIEASYYVSPDSYEAFKSTLLVLKVDTLLDLIVMNLSNNEIYSISVENIIGANKLGDISELLDIFNKPKHQVKRKKIWLGIVVEKNNPYLKIKLLVNLKNKIIDYNINNDDDWYNLEDSSFRFDDKNNLYINLRKYQIFLKFNNISKKLYIKFSDKETEKYKNYDKFLLGTENDYVFNEDDELELICNN